MKTDAYICQLLALLTRSFKPEGGISKLIVLLLLSKYHFQIAFRTRDLSLIFIIKATMPTAKAFEAVPPFPDDVPVYELPRLSLSKLISDDPEQSRELFDSFRTHGFALLDMQGCVEGEALLAEAEKMFEITRQVTVDLALEEKMKYEASPRSIFGCVPFFFSSSSSIFVLVSLHL